jgi:O-antigen/teichoic acid export membrane protein
MIFRFFNTYLRNLLPTIQIFLIIIVILNKVGIVFFISFLSKNMNLNDFGIIRYNINISNFYAIPMVGINSALVTFLSRKSIRIKYFFTFNAFLLLILVIFLELLYFVYIQNVYLSLFVIVALLDAYYIANLSGYNSFKKINFYRTSQISFQILSLFALYHLDVLSVKSISILYFSSTLISILILEIISYEVKIKFSYSIPIIKQLVKYSNFALIGSISFTLYMISNAYFIKKYFSFSDYAKFSTIDILSNLFTLLPIASSSYLIANVSKSNSILNSKKIINKNILFYIITSILSFSLLNTFFIKIMSFIFKENLILSIDFFRLSALSYFLLSLHLYISYYFFAKNNPKVPAFSITVSLILNFLLSFYFISIFGLIGLLFANILAMAIGFTIIFINYLKDEY